MVPMADQTDRIPQKTHRLAVPGYVSSGAVRGAAVVGEEYRGEVSGDLLCDGEHHVCHAERGDGPF